MIGKAPQKVILCLGATELEQGAPASTLLDTLHTSLSLIQDKTHAHTILVTPPVGFFVEGKARQEAERFETGAKALVNQSRTHISTSAVVAQFLSAHRENEGEKRALHVQATRPTTLGRLLLADSIVKSVNWGLS